MLQSRESRKIFGETETRKMDPRRNQSRGLESRLQALVHTVLDYDNTNVLLYLETAGTD